MIPVVWGDTLRKDYLELWHRCILSLSGMKYGRQTAAQIIVNKPRYDVISKQTGVPWWFIGCLHKMEAGLDFHKHLHNGDPLIHRTVQVPAGRPPLPLVPPFTWEQSALDAIHLKGLDHNKDWSVAHCLYLMEGYNGYGYRQYHPTVKSPYIWSMTNNYSKGKYVADGHYDANAVSGQVGIACILKELKVFDAAGKLLI